MYVYHVPIYKNSDENKKEKNCKTEKGKPITFIVKVHFAITIRIIL